MTSTGEESVLFSSLPKWRAPWSEFVLSYGTQVIVVAVVAWLPIMHPQVLERPSRDYHAIELVPTPVPVNHQLQVQLSRPVLQAKLDPPLATVRLLTPQPRLKSAPEDTPVPEVRIAPKNIDLLPNRTTPLIPRQIVRTNIFSAGSSAPQSIENTPQKVQTGGFGDPDGVPARNQTRAVNIAQVGGFEMPSGYGYGNGTSTGSGARGVVASAGFGNGVAAGTQRSPSTAVHVAGFGDADLAAPPTVQSRPAAQVSARTISAEIISKPLPLYTEEARARRIEGEVLLEVVLEASGNLRVVRVIRGLGHGLDDSAVRAAQQIRFKPALKDGQPSDSTAVVHIVFQLA